MKHLAGEDRNPERDGIGPEERTSNNVNAYVTHLYKTSHMSQKT